MQARAVIDPVPLGLLKAMQVAAGLSLSDAIALTVAPEEGSAETT